LRRARHQRQRRSCGYKDAHLGRINVFTTRPRHGALGGKYVSRAVLFDLEPGVIGAVKTGPKASTKRLSTNFLTSPPCGVAAFVINSEPHTGARHSASLYVGPKLARYVHLSTCASTYTERRLFKRALQGKF
jgi:hypothetical protein